MMQDFGSFNSDIEYPQLNNKLLPHLLTRPAAREHTSLQT